MTLVLLVIDPPGLAIADEFETLLLALDLHALTPLGWARMKSLITLATLNASNEEMGRRAYDSALERWRACLLYDGST